MPTTRPRHLVTETDDLTTALDLAAQQWPALSRPQIVLDILRDLDVAELAFPTDTAARLARLQATTGLKLPDCCVLLSADAESARIASFDDRVNKAAELPGFRWATPGRRTGV